VTVSLKYNFCTADASQTGTVPTLTSVILSSSAWRRHPKQDHHQHRTAISAQISKTSYKSLMPERSEEGGRRGRRMCV